MKVFIAHSSEDRKLVSSLDAALKKQGDTLLDPFEIEVKKELLSEITSVIYSSDVVIALAAPRNLNVILELGLALGANKPVLIAGYSETKLPADLSAIPYIELSGDVPRDVHYIIKQLSNFQITKSEKKTDFDSAEAALKEAIKDQNFLASIHPTEFERLIAKFFEEKGFKVTNLEESPDAGFDFMIESPLFNKKILVQAKKLNQQSKVSVETVRKLISAIPFIGATAGLLISTSGYTPAATSLGIASSLVLKSLAEIISMKSDRELLDTKTSNN